MPVDEGLGETGICDLPINPKLLQIICVLACTAKFEELAYFLHQRKYL